MPRKSSKRGTAFSSPVLTVILLVLLSGLAVWWGIDGYTKEIDSPGSPPPAAGASAAPDSGAPALAAHFISVGKADSILILSEGRSMLIDAGTGKTKSQLVEYIRKAGVETLDVVIATHPHEDHIGGMEEVLRELGAKQFYTTYAEHTTKAYEKMLDAIEEGAIPANIPSPGQSFTLGNATCTFLAPLREDYSEMNDTSLVLRVECNGKTILFTGDIEIAAERDLALAHEGDGMLKCDVLKVPHHGSKTSSSAAFLELARPDWAVITCAPDDQPSNKIIERLENYGIHVVMNDMSTIICEIFEDIKFTIGTEL